MKAHRLALAELRRISSGRLLRLALVALLLLPTMYAGLYLLANKDPYGNLDGVPAAIVVEDEGATLADGTRINEGDTIARRLASSGAFSWSRVDRAEAEAGVREERYDFALVVPKTFSADLRSVAGSDPKAAHLEQISNDANGYLARSIANGLLTETTTAIASDVSRTSAANMLDGFATTRDKTAQAVDGATKLHDGLVTLQTKSTDLSTGLDKLSTGAASAASGTASVATGADSVAKGADDLSAGTGKLAASAPKIADGATALATAAPALADGATKAADGITAASAGANTLAKGTRDYLAQLDAAQAAMPGKLKAAGLTDAQIAAVAKELAPARTGAANLDAGAQKLAAGLAPGATAAAQLKTAAATFATSAKQLGAGASELSKGATSLDAGAKKLATGSHDLATGAHKAADGTKTLSDGARTAAEGAKALPGAVTTAADGAESLRSGLASGLAAIPATTPQQRQAAAEVIGAPVVVDRSNQATASTYGEGMAPFFLSLSLWIGAYVLFLIVRPLSHRALAAGQPAWRVALSGWMTPALVGVGQAILAYGIAVLGLGMHVEHPVRVVPFLALASITFVAILHALSARFGAVGKFLGLALLVLQLVSAGGTFPWQTLPSGLQAMHKVLPMTYAIDGVRHLMYGGAADVVVRDVSVLLGFFLVALLGSTYAAGRARTWTPARVKPDLVL